MASPLVMDHYLAIQMMKMLANNGNDVITDIDDLDMRG